MIVCCCHRVSEQDIVRHADAGCPDFETLQSLTCAGTNCGRCLEAARDTFQLCVDTRSVESQAQPMFFARAA